MHIFFNVLMLLIACRCATQITLLYLYYADKDLAYRQTISKMYYGNLGINMFLNVVILYYRIKTKINSDEVK